MYNADCKVTIYAYCHAYEVTVLLYVCTYIVRFFRNHVLKLIIFTVDYHVIQEYLAGHTDFWSPILVMHDVWKH